MVQALTLAPKPRRTNEWVVIGNVFGGLCCEMEGGAIAQICCQNEVPFVIIRAISDKADGSAEMDFTEFEHAAAVRCAAITRYMITH